MPKEDTYGITAKEKKGDLWTDIALKEIRVAYRQKSYASHVEYLKDSQWLHIGR